MIGDVALVLVGRIGVLPVLLVLVRTAASEANVTFSPEFNLFASWDTINGHLPVISLASHS